MTDIARLAIEIDSTSAKNAEKSLNGLEKQSGKTEQSAASMVRQFVGASAVLGTTIAVIKNSVKAATEYQSALTGLASIARYAGEDIQSTLGKATELTADGMLSVGESATAMKNLLAKGFNTQQAVEMINRLKDAAAFGKQGSLEFGQAVLSATEGIKNENSVLVDNAGVTKNISVMQEEYAQSIGKTVKQLSEAEKRQAVYNGLMKETEGQLGNSALAAQGMEGASARMNKAINDSAITIGQSFTPAAVALTNLLTEGLQGGMDNVIRPFLFLFESIGVSAGELVMKMGAVFDLIGSPKKWLDPQKAGKELSDQFKIYEDIAEKSRQEIAARLAGISTPVILGTDTGKRRQDVVQNDMKAEKEAAKELAAAYEEVNKILADVDPLVKANQEWQHLLDLQKATGAFTSEQLGQAYAKAMSGVAKANQDALDKMNENWKTFADNSQRTLSDVFYNGLTGKFQDIESAFRDMILRMIANASAARLTQALFGTGSGTSGTSTGWIGAIAGMLSFEGGGSTGQGSRTGGVDGRGGFPAIVHPNETVIDNTRNQSAGGGITLVDNTVINIDSRADRQQVMSDVSKLIEGKQAKLIDSLQRQGQLA